MANASFVRSLLGGLDDGVRKALGNAFDYTLGNIRFGQPADNTAAENFTAGFFSGTTSSVADQEFTIVHGLGIAPYMAIPVLPLASSAVEIPRLRITRPADEQRVYLSSPSTGIAIRLFVEM